MLPAKLALSYMNIFTFLEIKGTFNLWANACHVKCPLAPPRPHRTQDTITKSCMSQVKNRWAVTWQVLFFLPRVAGFPWPRSHMTLTLRFLVCFL